MRLLSVTLLWLVGALAASAQSHVDSLRQHELADVEVTSRALGRRVTALMPVQSMDEEQMKRLGLTTIAQVIRQMAGAEVRDYGGIGGLKTVSVRHLGAHHTAVSYDGMVVGNVQAGQIDLSHFSLDNVSNVRFAVGHDADIMQSARHYASAGLVDITTWQPASRPTLQAMLRTGAFGYVNPSVRLGRQWNENTSASADISLMRADGNYPFTLRNGQRKTLEHRQGSDVKSWQGEANLQRVFANDGDLALKIALYQSERGLPGGVVLYVNDPSERLWDEDYFAQMLYRKRLNRQWKLALRAKVEHAWNRYEDVNVKYPGGRQVDLNHQNEAYLSATLAFQPSESFSVAVAQDGVLGTLRNNIYEEANPERLTSLTNLTAKYARGRWKTEGNLLATWSREWIDDRANKDRQRLSPALSASFRLLDNAPFYLRAMLKQTFRMPSFNDLYYRRFGNVNLKSEKARLYDVGITWEGAIYNKVKLKTTLDAYLNIVDDKIVAFPTTYVWRMQNFGHVRITGVDASIAFAMGMGRNALLEGTFNYAYQHAADKTDRRHSTYNAQLPYTPKHSGNAALVLKNKWIDVGYTLQMCSERYSMALHSRDYRLHPYAEHNLTFSKDVCLLGQNWWISAGLMNLTNEQYDIIQYYPMPGRHWQASLSWRL
ncbi:MAG: TonB-dependent receptor [Prevotella sp.]|nr:TonB-dependent receptor [Prevotella sp.]